MEQPEGFQKFADDDFIILLLYVDDMLIVGKNAGRISQLKQHLSTGGRGGGYRGGTSGSNNGCGGNGASSCSGNGKRPGKGNGGRSLGRGGAVGGSPPPPRAADGDQGGNGSSLMPNPNDPRCGNIQMVQFPNGFIISYDCGNCNYQYTIDYNGMTTGYGSVTSF
ncbi:hypothetical protein POM88_029351 [Heracleum sosnowskyi]|uniref:Reverse transcriptase Ty1/copia-type domain-containing protein n=1 Tax=Heracleum sosnowskyi TaxID=360622 RepID=A0AAD8MIE1_9APIA|nr:hypothetical protein POM88_029351 [Heracleum sosnowskyi]